MTPAADDGEEVEAGEEAGAADDGEEAGGDVDNYDWILPDSPDPNVAEEVPYQ